MLTMRNEDAIRKIMPTCLNFGYFRHEGQTRASSEAKPAQGQKAVEAIRQGRSGEADARAELFD